MKRKGEIGRCHCEGYEMWKGMDGQARVWLEFGG